MSLSPVTRKSDFRNSIKKYFLDSLEVTESLSLFFDSLVETPTDASGVKLTKWVTISFGRSSLGSVSEAQISLEAFTRNDSEGDDLASLLDTIMGYIVDEDSTNGLVSIPYYDTSAVPWTIVGGMIPYVQPSLSAMDGLDNTRFEAVNILCKWGGK